MNEPVAWRIKNKNGEWLYYDEELVGTEPLYAHPVKEELDTRSYLLGRYDSTKAQNERK